MKKAKSKRPPSSGLSSKPSRSSAAPARLPALPQPHSEQSVERDVTNDSGNLPTKRLSKIPQQQPIVRTERSNPSTSSMAPPMKQGSLRNLSPLSLPPKREPEFLAQTTAEDRTSKVPPLQQKKQVRNKRGEVALESLDFKINEDKISQEPDPRLSHANLDSAGSFALDDESLLSAAAQVCKIGKEVLLYSKISVIGEGLAGKSTVINSMLGHDFRVMDRTVGMDATMLEVSNHVVQCSGDAGAIWSTYQPDGSSVLKEVQSRMIADVLLKMSSEASSEQLAGEQHVEREEKTSLGSIEQPAADSNATAPIIDRSMIAKFLDVSQNSSETLKLLLEDFGGQSVFYELYNVIFSEFGVYLLVFDMNWLLPESKDRAEALQYLRHWLYTVATHTQFRPDGRSFSKCAPIFLVGTHKDEVSDPKLHHEINRVLIESFRGVPSWSAIRLFKQGKTADDRVVLHFFPVDNVLGIKDRVIGILMEQVVQCVRAADHLRHEVPFCWMSALDKLEEMKQRNQITVAYDDFKTICRGLGFHSKQGEGLDEDVKSALRFFDKLGIIMYKEYVPHLILIRPAQFLFPYITKIICNFDMHSDLISQHRDARKALTADWKLLTSQGILTSELLDALWKGCPYSTEVKKLMCRLDLMVITSPHTDGAVERYLVPSVLPEQVKTCGGTVSFTAFALFSDEYTSQSWEQRGFVEMSKIASDGFLPAGVFSRLISRLVSLPIYHRKELYRQYASFNSSAQGFKLTTHTSYIRVEITSPSPTKVVEELEHHLNQILSEHIPNLHFLFAVPSDGGRDKDWSVHDEGKLCLAILTGARGVKSRERCGEPMRVTDDTWLDRHGLRERFRGWLLDEGGGQQVLNHPEVAASNCQSISVNNLFKLVRDVCKMFKPDGPGGYLDCTSRDLERFFKEHKIDPKVHFSRYYSSCMPLAAVTYEWDTPFTRLETYFLQNSLEATRWSLKRAGRSEDIPTDPGEVLLWIDILFVNQNAKDVVQELKKADEIYEGAKFHFVVGTRNVLSRCWCLYELLTRVKSQKRFILLQRDETIYRAEDALDVKKGIEDARSVQSALPDFFGKMRAFKESDKIAIQNKILAEFDFPEIFNGMVLRAVSGTTTRPTP